jgi:indolepyruvate ferredoxin oxidoreductase
MGEPSPPHPRRGEFRLSDRYTVERGTVLLSGVQALVRLPLDRHRADARAGLRTGTFVSGYPGSPLGGLDLAFEREAELMAAHDVHLVPGVNEELAATAVWGSQQSRLGALAGRDGVVGIWYGKAPGVDRCGDVFKHANLMGVAPTGGMLVLAGDDPVSKSSTIPSASETALADAQIPVLCPGNPQEILDLGMHAVAMSRFSGLIIGIKLVTDVADGFATAEVAPDRIVPVLPAVEVDGRPWRYAQGGLALPGRNLGDEHQLAYGRQEAALAYTHANGLNMVTAAGGDHPRVGIVAAGKTYHDVVHALRELGVHDLESDLARLGVRLLRLGVTWPLEPRIVRTFAEGLDEVVVVEEKRSFVELQLRDALYDLDVRPRVVGKRDEKGHPFVPADGELDPELIARLLTARIGDPALAAGLPRSRRRLTLVAPATGAPDGVTASEAAGAVPARAPYFCSGCPHNRSTPQPLDARPRRVGGGWRHRLSHDGRADRARHRRRHADGW